MKKCAGDQQQLRTLTKALCDCLLNLPYRINVLDPVVCVLSYKESQCRYRHRKYEIEAIAQPPSSRRKNFELQLHHAIILYSEYAHAPEACVATIKRYVN